MNKMTNILLTLSTLSLCALITTDSFAMQQSLKRKGSEPCFLFDDRQQDQKKQHVRQFMRLSYPVECVDNANFSAFAQLPGDLRGYILSKADNTYTLCNLATASKSMRSYVTIYLDDSSNIAYVSQQYLNSAIVHSKRIELRKEELKSRKWHSLGEKPLRRNIRKQLSSARYNLNMAELSHNMGEFGEVVSSSQKILDTQISRDHMMIDDV